MDLKAGITGIEGEWRQIMILHPLGERPCVLRRRHWWWILGEPEEKVERRSKLVSEVLGVLVERAVIDGKEADNDYAEASSDAAKCTVPTASPPFLR